MKSILLLASLLSVLPALNGCATKIDLSNRLVRTEACDEMMIVSKWTKWFGVSSNVDARDAAATLERCKAEKARVQQGL